MELRRDITNEELKIISEIDGNLDKIQFKEKGLIREKVDSVVAVLVMRPDLPLSERIKLLEIVNRVSKEVGTGRNAKKVQVKLFRILAELDFKVEDLKKFVKRETKPDRMKENAVYAGETAKRKLIDDGWIWIVGIAAVIIVVVLIIVILAILTEGKCFDGLEGLAAIDKLPFDGKVIGILTDISPGLIDSFGSFIPQERIQDEEWFRRKVEQKMSGG